MNCFFSATKLMSYVCSFYSLLLLQRLNEIGWTEHVALREEINAFRILIGRRQDRDEMLISNKS
jgi:hypothetical protein